MIAHVTHRCSPCIVLCIFYSQARLLLCWPWCTHPSTSLQAVVSALCSVASCCASYSKALYLRTDLLCSPLASTTTTMAQVHSSFQAILLLVLLMPFKQAINAHRHASDIKLSCSESSLKRYSCGCIWNQVESPWHVTSAACVSHFHAELLCV